MFRPPVEPMRAVGVTELPEPTMCRGGCAYEPKFDGFRSLAFIDDSGIYLQSRQAKNLTPYFPDIAAALHKSVAPGTVLDGELIVFDTVTGRTSFTDLLARVIAGHQLLRRAAARPATLVVFDVLADAGTDLTGQPLQERRARLERLLAAAPPAVALCPHTTDVAMARTWFDELAVTGVEGLVVKDLASRYQPGRPG
ncbi:ATP-dependent DNA ligase [Couchioplanes caeruleus]|uniref:ATP-dependent DNA ligase n=1 Tax=Couchioplanes caeruleus TaxID=56438 RepID=UPI001FD51747|nr:hypothetical protein [Couchioplanes caeruleus]